MTEDRTDSNSPARINLTVNRDMVCRSINESGAAVLGKPVFDCLGARLERIFPGKDISKIANSVDSFFKTGIDSFLQAEISISGALKKYEILITPVKDNLDEIILARITASEVIDFEKIFRKASEVEILRKMSAALSAVAHEVNNPLSVILGYSEIILLDELLDKEMAEKIRAMKDHAERIKKLIIQMTDITRIETKPYVMGSEILDIQHSCNPEVLKKKSI
ncbi:histidine kinase dimerization/phospho-acceptor domain-containing protein [candidate division KSB1 bacterium]